MGRGGTRASVTDAREARKDSARVDRLRRDLPAAALSPSRGAVPRREAHKLDGCGQLEAFELFGHEVLLAARLQPHGAARRPFVTGVARLRVRPRPW
jgi:hypothetical protein